VTLPLEKVFWKNKKLYVQRGSSMPAPTHPMQAGQLIQARDGRLLVARKTVSIFETVPNFVPTTKPYRV